MFFFTVHYFTSFVPIAQQAQTDGAPGITPEPMFRSGCPFLLLLHNSTRNTIRHWPSVQCQHLSIAAYTALIIVCLQPHFVSICAVGDFNVSNLMGIKRRMIDIGKKQLFTFCKMFENVQFFSHLHLKYAKSAIMTQKIFFLKNINMSIKKRRILC
jgi:hypothetical protein